MRPVGPESVPDPLFDRRRASGTRRVVAVLLLACVIGVIAALVALAFSFRSGPDVQPGMKVEIVIPSGASASDVAQILADEGVVANRTTFLARLRLNGEGSSFRAGKYRMLTGSSYDTIVQKLNAGPPPPATFTLTFPEGGRIADIARRIEDTRAARASEGAPPLPVFSGDAYAKAVARYRVPAQYNPPAGTKTMEGFLFPATFELATKADPDDLIERQMQAFEDNFASIDMSYARSRNLTPYEVVIIASLVEREARLAKERPLVAAVIYNRLKERMTLGIDATIQYAVSGPSGWKTTITQSDLEIDSPYNSRTRLGLPPTPIANPGLASLQAAARPAKVDYLYYVANPDASKGNHFFTKSFEEFNNHPYQQR
jgi:UPF0755 protein